MPTTNGEVQRIPPERKPVSEFPTPSHAVAFYTELVVRTDPAYKANAPVKRGSRYSTMVGAKQDVITTYPDLFFLQETRYGNDDQRVLWHWATDEHAHDTYNADVNYVANSVTFPAFTRVYTTRRELYEAEPTLSIGSPLLGIISVEITSPGQNHTKASGVIPDTSVEIDFVVDSNGSLISAVITNTGNELIQDGTEITIIGDGQDSSAIAHTQPIGCILTAQKKEELPADDPTQHELVRITRTYETLPGPWIYSERFDKDGMIVTTKTRRNIKELITDEDYILNDEWVQVSHVDVDDFIADEKSESRPIPGNPIVTTRVEVDGEVMTVTKTLIDASTGVSGETLAAGVWTKTSKEEINSTTFIKSDSPASEKVCWQVSEARPIPGNAMTDTKVDKDGFPKFVVKTLKDTTTITSGEVLSGGIWITTEKEAVSELVAWEVVSARQVPGNNIPSANVNADHEISTISTRLRDQSTITPSVSEAGGVITTVEKREVTDLVSDEIITTKEWLDEALYQISIENMIPREFRAFIPTVVESHILAGTASMPTLGLGEFEVSERQMTALLYERRTTSFGDITLPITHTNQETTELYGGGVLNVNYSLVVHDSVTIDEGYLVTRSTLLDLGNGMDIKETAQLDGTEWPTLLGKAFDQEMQILYPFEEQVVPIGYVPSTGTEAFVVETVDVIDEWRSKRRKITKQPTALGEASAIVTYRYHPFRFPGLLTQTLNAYYVRASNSELCRHTIRTWWENSITEPVIAVSEIVMDDPIISTLNDISTLAYAGPCLHNAFFTFSSFFWPATTPSHAEYTGLEVMGFPGQFNFTAGSANVTGSGGTQFLSDLQIGDTIGLSPSGSIWHIAIIFSDTLLQLDNPYPITGVSSVIITRSTGTPWIGNEKIIAATVQKTDIPNLWKIETTSVVMR